MDDYYHQHRFRYQLNDIIGNENFMNSTLWNYVDGNWVLMDYVYSNPSSGFTASPRTDNLGANNSSNVNVGDTGTEGNFNANYRPNGSIDSIWTARGEDYDQILIATYDEGNWGEHGWVVITKTEWNNQAPLSNIADSAILNTVAYGGRSFDHWTTAIASQYGSPLRYSWDPTTNALFPVVFIRGNLGTGIIYKFPNNNINSAFIPNDFNDNANNGNNQNKLGWNIYLEGPNATWGADYNGFWGNHGIGLFFRNSSTSQIAPSTFKIPRITLSALGSTTSSSSGGFSGGSSTTLSNRLLETFHSKANGVTFPMTNTNDITPNNVSGKQVLSTSDTVPLDDTPTCKVTLTDVLVGHDAIK